MWRTEGIDHSGIRGDVRPAYQIDAVRNSSEDLIENLADGARRAWEVED
jgi:hypothetical protein